MLVLVVALVATNLLALGAVVWLLVRPREYPEPDPVVAASIENMRPPASTSSTRRIITIEILNPLELARTRGRLAGIAGSLAPGITRRVVYDQTIRILRRQLVDEKVVADVRLHTVGPKKPDPGSGEQPNAPVVDVVEVAPPVEPLET